MNDTNRNQWIDNHEGLFNLWKTSKLSKREFIKRNRKQLDKFISHAVKGESVACEWQF